MRRCQEWAARDGRDVVVVFDGDAPAGAVATGAESADDWLARETARHAGAFWLVTSDRGLRARAAGAERVIGGGAFLQELG